MTIRFQAQIDDSHNESLLLWLEDHYGTNWVHKAAVLRAALSWLELSAPHKAMNAEESESSLRADSNPVMP
jgi:hypothetical protein